MKSGVPWNVKGVGRQARETAREAARRSGMSVGQWLDTVIIDSALDGGDESQRGMRNEPIPDDFAAQHAEDRPAYRMREERYPEPDDIFRAKRRKYAEHDERQRLAAQVEPGVDYVPAADPRDRAQPVVEQSLVEVKQRLDGLTQQLDLLARHHIASAANAKAPPAPPPVRDDDTSRQLVAVMSKLDRRLDQLVAESRSAKHEMERRVSAVDRAVADLRYEQPRQAIPAADPATPLDQALLEIADRQRALDSSASAGAGGDGGQSPMVSEPLPRARTQEFATLERELRHINHEIATLKSPYGIDKAVETLRDDLAEIGVMLQDAMPRKAIEAIESELRRLGDRVEQTRHAGGDGATLAGLERGLTEVRDALHALTPAENLVGFNEAVKGLSQKFDLLANNSQDPTALKQLEGAILAMRGIVSHVASNDALATLSEEVRALSAKVEQASHAGGGDVISSLERRISTLADALEARNRSGQDVPHEIEAVVNGLIDKIERIQLSRGDHSAVGHLEERIAKLVEKLDASNSRLNHLEAIERGLAELLIHLEHQRLPNLARAEVPPESADFHRELADLKQIDKKTQDAIEAVHGTLGHVVDRLAMIETDIRQKGASANAVLPKQETSPQAPTASPMPAPKAGAGTGAAAAVAAALAPATVNPKVETVASAPAADPQRSPALPTALPPAPTLLAPTRDTIEPAALSTQPNPMPSPAVERRPIDPDLPPDHPLEPGSGATRLRNAASPADRIAASEAALGSAKPPVIPDPGGKSNFIAAARRAAQAAAREAPARSGPPTGPVAGPSKLGQVAGLLSKNRRLLIVCASVIVIIAGLLHIVTTWLGSNGETTGGPASESTISTPTAAAPATTPAPTNAEETPAPSGSGRQSNLSPGLGSSATGMPSSGVLLSVDSARQATAKPPSPAEREVTGSVQPPAKPQSPSTASVATAKPAPAANSPVTTAIVTPAGPPIPAGPTQSVPAAPTNGPDRLPTSLSAALRTAAANDDPTAQYEIAVRLAEGRGVPQNLPEAAEWFERAAKHGLIPAQFRLGGLYEKGLGVKKNLDTARRLYTMAGEAGNAKALHNLAVLYAEGIDGKPDYQTAAKWFRKAATYGVTDSQYNLGILYARGIGVEQNLAEAYRWFAQAARNGDKDALKKRDDVAGRLDRQSLAAAQQAAESFQPQPQPEAATEVKVPPGGWDAAATGRRKPPVVGPKVDLSTPRTGR